MKPFLSQNANKNEKLPDPPATKHQLLALEPKADLALQKQYQAERTIGFFFGATATVFFGASNMSQNWLRGSERPFVAVFFLMFLLFFSVSFAFSLPPLKATFFLLLTMSTCMSRDPAAETTKSSRMIT